ncbi:MAG: MASE1 domain-containing protein [Chthoniobacteraceae bacterium]
MTDPSAARIPSHFDARRWVEVLLLAALYFCTARLGLLTAMPGGHVTPVWPPSGIALAAVLLLGRRVWPGIWLGSFAANLWDFLGSTPGVATGLATVATLGMGATLAALAGGYLLRRFVGERDLLERVRDVCAFLALGGVLSCLISATIGVTALCMGGFAAWSGFGQTWLTWWLGDTAGVFVVSPLFLVWSGPWRVKTLGRLLELCVCFCLLIAVSYYVFVENKTELFSEKPLTFLVMPFLVWSAVRFGKRGAAMAVGLIALLAVWGTIHHSGPFNIGPRNEALLLLELFLGVAVLTSLCVAAMTTERAHVDAELQRSVEELESRVQARTSALMQSEEKARGHMAEAEQSRAALLSILEDERAAQEALRLSESNYRTLIESASDGILVADAQGAFVDVNEAGCRMLGYARSEVPAMRNADILHADEAVRVAPEMAELNAGKVVRSEWRLLRKDGTMVPSEVGATLLPDGRLLGILRDVSERRLAEAAIREKHGLLTAVIEGTSDAIFAKDVDGRYQMVNTACAQAVGLPAAAILGRTDADLHPAETARRYRETDDEVVASGRMQMKEECSEMPDGTHYWLTNKAPLRDADGRIVGIVGISRDITERHRAEDALRQSRGQLRALAAHLQDVREKEQTRIAREIHDELGQMLTGLKMDLRWMERELDGSGSGADANALLERAVAASALVDETVKAVQQIAAELRPGVLDRLGLPTALRHECRQFQQRSGVVCRVTVPEPEPEVPAEVATVCFRTCQEALTNVARHAGATEVTIDFRSEAGAWLLELRDNGTGITAEALMNPRSLGLLGMQERAARLGGEIRVEPGAEGGTIVRLSIPEGGGKEQPL